MGAVEEYFDRQRVEDFLVGKRDTPFSQEDIRQAKEMGVDLKAEREE